MSQNEPYQQGDKIAFISEYGEGDVIKFEFKERKFGTQEIHYSKILSVKPSIDENNDLQLCYVTENGKYIKHQQILELVRRG